uniref:ATP synthase complex subunit 8 n=1 Tax=Xyela sp. ZJUH_2016036 TaxID=2491173 RepID=A0A3Q8UAE9_9HYME|nr:ATP synthase F0 subunit 8 [Xyela sp. ZJUH_2016036]
MPQMAPISWLTLYLIFFLILILFNILNYFCYSPKPITSKPLKLTLNIPSMIWKW